MIISKLSGGLGNQLFQYAAGRSLAISNNTELLLDISFYDNSPNRIYILNEFNITSKIITQKEIYSILGERNKFFPDKLRGRNRFNAHHPLVYREKHFHFDPSVKNLKSPVLLDGYWQSENYFRDHETVIRKECTLKNSSSFENNILLESIRKSNAVAVHLRRGDYKSIPRIHDIHGILGNDYYLRAAGIIKEKAENPVYFVFSDDIQEADALLSELGNGINISRETNNNQFLDFYLMQHCKHIIMANSSFSWWAAWLNPNVAKMVVAPKNWFKDSSKDTSGLYCKNWIVV